MGGQLKIRNAADDAWILLGGVGTIVQQDAEPDSPHAGMMWLDTDATTGYQQLIQDADGDTMVQVEESADEDIVRIDAGGNEIWVGHSSGAIQKPLLPYCYVTLTEDSDDLPGLQYATCPIDDDIIDVGNNFNTDTYSFTAPKDGVYQVSTGLTLGGYLHTVTNMFWYIFTTNRWYIMVSSPTMYDSGGNRAHTQVASVELDENDICNIQLWHGGASTIDWSEYCYMTIAMLA